jgi:hypothetical protein
MIPFAPEIAVPALRAMQSTYGNLIYSTYGFVDAFNPTFTTQVRMPLGHVDRTRGWFDTDYLGIDEGPVLAMIENYRTELIWTTMRRSPYIIRGLQRAGFTGGWLDHVAPPAAPVASSAVAPAAPTAAPAKPVDQQPSGTPPLAPAQPSSASPPPTPAPAPAPQGPASPAAGSPQNASPSGTTPPGTTAPATSSSPPATPAQTPSSAPTPARPPNR